MFNHETDGIDSRLLQTQSEVEDNAEVIDSLQAENKKLHFKLDVLKGVVQKQTSWNHFRTR